MFGCLCFLFLYPYHNHKLDFYSSSYVFLGYISSHLGYRCFDITSQQIYISLHVCFHERVFSFDKYKQITLPALTPSLKNSTNVPNFLTSPIFHSLMLAASRFYPLTTGY
jgi:histone deacetylase 1/2